MLLEAERSLFLLGGGVILAEACDEFVKLAEYLSIPMVTTLMGKGGIRADHPLYARQVGIQCNTRSGNQVLWIYLLVTRAMRVRMPHRELKWEIPIEYDYLVSQY